MAAVALVLWSGACGGSPGPTGPGPVNPPATTTPPVIQSVTVTVQRVEVDTPVIITAQVEDSDINPQSLRYEWTANAGTFEGAGQAVTWRAAKGSVVTPTDVVVTLNVFEPYQALENGVIVIREYRVSQSATPFRLHDSVAEISKMAVTFLVDYFGNSSVSPDACMVDFTPSCRGTEDERDDVEENRRDRIIYAAHATVTSVLVDANGTFARLLAACGWEDASVLTPNLHEFPEGQCILTAVYESGRWWLCSSNFQQPRSATAMDARFWSEERLRSLPTIAGGVNNFGRTRK